MMRVDDFVCIGRTVPEESKKYGHRVCMAGYSVELGQLMRVYPLPVVNILHSRGMYSMELRRNNQDSRGESWRLKTDESVEHISDVSSEVVRRDLQAFAAASISQLNQDRKSLGVILPHGQVTGDFSHRSSVTNPLQATLFDISDHAFGANAIDLIPYLTFFDDAGPHHLQLREWGCYEWLRKSRHMSGQLWRNLRLHEPQMLVVGNMSNQRTTWLVIKTFVMQLTPQLSLGFDEAKS